jgi:hypothetical protein
VKQGPLPPTSTHDSLRLVVQQADAGPLLPTEDDVSQGVEVLGDHKGLQALRERDRQVTRRLGFDSLNGLNRLLTNH